MSQISLTHKIQKKVFFKNLDWILTRTRKVPQSNFLSIVIFLAFIAISWEAICCTESRHKGIIGLVTKTVKKHSFCDQLLSFVELAKCNILVLRKKLKMPKMVKIEIHCTSKIRLGYHQVRPGIRPSH